MSTTQRHYRSVAIEPCNEARHSHLQSRPSGPVTEQAKLIFVVDSDTQNRDGLRDVLKAHGYKVETFADCTTFLTTHQVGRRGCLLVDLSTPGAGGIELIKELKSSACGLAVIAMSNRFVPAMVVQAMKAGASDCLERPIADDVLVGTLERVIDESADLVEADALRALAVQRVDQLTARQREILDLIAVGQPSKNIAADLKISQRTVENHRAAIARKTCSRSLSEVVHAAICANCSLMKARH